MPGAPNVLDLVHRSSAEVTACHGEHVHIDDAALEALASELAGAAEDVAGAVRGLPLPIKFSNLEQELTLLLLYHLLDFGSGYDKELLRLPGGRDARDTLLYGLIGLHLGGAKLDYHKLKSFSMYDIHQVFGIEATTEVAIMPGVTMAKPGPLQPLCKLMLSALNDTGAILEGQGNKTPGELLLSIGAGLRKAGCTTASAFVEELVDTLPAFQDAVLYDGRTLTLHRKAQNLAADLAVVYGSRDERFNFSDVDRLAADSGATTIAVLRAKGVLRCSDELSAIIDRDTELPAGPHERALRAAAVTACIRLVAATAAAPSAVPAPSGAAPEAAAPEAVAAQEPGGGATGHSSEAGSEAGDGSSVQGELPVEGLGDGRARAAAAAKFRAVDVGAYLSYLVEEGRELHGKISKHITKGIIAY